MSRLVRTTQRPFDDPIVVSDAEYFQMLTLGMVYGEAAPGPPDPDDVEVSTFLENETGPTYAALVAAMAAIAAGDNPFTVQQRAASVTAVEEEPAVNPAGAWDFAQAPTVAGVAIGTGSGSAPDATPTTKGLVQLAGDLGGTAASPMVPGLTGKVPSTRTVSAGTGLSGGGDLSANRTLAVTYGTTAGTAAQGNDARLTAAALPPVQLKRATVGGTWTDAAGVVYDNAARTALRPHPIYWLAQVAGAEPAWGTNAYDANTAYGDIVNAAT